MQGYGYRQGPPPKRPALAWLPACCGFTAMAAIVLVVAVAIAGFVFRGPGETIAPEPPSSISTEPEPFPEPSLEPKPGPQPSPEVGDWAQRPRWGELTGLLDRLESSYVELIPSGEIYDLLPHGEAVGPKYVETFRLAVVEMKVMMRWGYRPTTNADEMDDIIAGDIEGYLELERQLLEGEHLAFSMSVTVDGVTTHYDGRNLALQDEPPPVPAVDAPSEAYEFARAQEDWLGDDGTYIAAGEELAAAFGITVSYSFAEFGQACPSGRSYSDWAGAFCGNSPDVIYIPADVADSQFYPEYFTNHTYLDVVRHEIAHALIYDHCDTFSPQIAGERYEGVTNSYAVLYLGADRDELFTGVGESGWDYSMDSETDAIAESIANGTCR